MRGLPDEAFWRDRRVLLTGHTGFKGAWLTCWLRSLGAEVMGVSLPEPVSDPDLWSMLPDLGIADIRADVAGTTWQTAASDFDPEIVFHLAAQALVPRSFTAPTETFASNVMGTVRLLEALTSFPHHLGTLVATTDKVYDTRQPTPFAEDAHVGGQDPYSASKACAELVVRSWPHAHVVGTARAGNVIGGGDWASDRLLPDLDRAWHRGEPLVLRRPAAVRPWQHVLEPLRGYLLYAEHLALVPSSASSLNFGPAPDQCIAVDQLVDHAATQWQQLTGKEPTWQSLDQPPMHETDLLELDSTLAEAQLGWRNVLDWRKSVEATLAWNAAVRAGEPAAELVARQLDDYVKLVGASG